MSYIGNQVTTVPFITDTFSGTGSATAFTLTRAPAGTAAIAVFVGGSYTAPINYSISGVTLNFVSAPTAGTNNIVVLHLGTGSATQVPSDGSVTSIKIGAAAVTGDKIGLTAINANNIVDGTITLAKIASGVLPSAIANSAAVYANGAFTSANASFIQANAAFTQANTAASTGKAIARSIVFG